MCMLQKQKEAFEGVYTLANNVVDIVKRRHNELRSQHAASERAYRSQNDELRSRLEDMQSQSETLWQQTKTLQLQSAKWRDQAGS